MEWHDRLYPPIPRTALTPLRPDRFGEDFVARHLKDDPRAVELFDRVTPNRRCLIVLAAAGERHEHVREVLFSLLENNPGLVLYASVPLIDLLIDHAPHRLCEIVSTLLPVYRTDLLDASVRLARHVLDGLAPDRPPLHRALQLTELAARLVQAGDPSGALEPAREAVEIQRGLSGDRPEDLAHLAVALGNLSEVLGALGIARPAVQAAREAVDLFSQVAELNPNSYGIKFVQALEALGRRLAGVGDVEAAVSTGRRAVALSRELIGPSPLPAHLGTLAALLHTAGDTEEALAHAREAVAIARRLVAEDRAAYLAQLAGLVRNLGAFLGEAGDITAAMEATAEAVTLYRELVADQPAAYLADLAVSLSNLGFGTAEQGDKARGLVLAREAIGILDELAATHNPAAHMLSLARAHRKPATGELRGGPRPDALPEAIDAASVAVSLYARLGAVTPQLYAAEMRQAFGILQELLATARAERPNG